MNKIIIFFKAVHQKIFDIINITFMVMPHKLVHKFFRQFDMFSSFATWRTDGQPETRNTFGGILSLLILIIFIYLFISQFIQVANWQQIQSGLTQNNTFDSSRSISNFMVGVGMQNLRIQGITEYLRFQILEITKNGSKVALIRTLETQKCTLNHLVDLGQQAQASFNSFNLKNKLCLVLGQNYSIQQPSDGVYSTLVVQVNSCRRMFPNGTLMYQNCASENITNYRGVIWAETYKYFVAHVVYINTAFNPLSETSTTKFMEQIRLTFTLKLGSQAFVSLSTYQVDTDVSIFPIQEIQTQNGYFLESIRTNNYEIIWYFQHASCTFLLSSTSIIMNRALGKIDQVLSYAGGLFGIIISFLSFFMMSFNKYRYEILAAQSAFKCNQDGRKIRQQDFNFFIYVKYTIFDWVKILTCHQLQWKDCQSIDQTLEQAVKQLDISLMFKKIQYFERFIEHVITDKQKIGLFLTEPPSIQTVKKKRMVAQYYDKIIKGKPAATIENLNIVSGIFQLANGQLVSNNLQQGSKSSLTEMFNYDRDDFIEYFISKYEQMKIKQEQHQDEEIQLSEQQQIVQKQIALAVFTIAEQKRKKLILRKIPLKILKRLYYIKMNILGGASISINLEI